VNSVSSSAPRPEPQKRPSTWRILTATERGAAHVAAGLPNQDAVAAYPLDPHGAVVAVADGHGHRRHFRSARGSHLAVTIACQLAEGLPGRLANVAGAREVEDEARKVLVPAIAEQWRTAVSSHFGSEPFTAEEEALRIAGDEAVVAYGSTLLLAVALRQWLVLAQIGDGDIVCILPDGGALLPLPGDPSLDGVRTTSLCQPGAVDEFRIAIVDMSITRLLGVVLATDGYGNAQLADPWPRVFCKDLQEMLDRYSPEWLAGQLPIWAGRCASGDGSADDTTIAILLARMAGQSHGEGLR
jgi:Protein phosphatase 2C